MQTEQLAYVIVTPYSMRKSRTGGIVGRLISRTGLDLVGGRMFAPGTELARRYADTIVTETDPRHRATQQLIRDYVVKNFTGENNGQRPRALIPCEVIEAFSPSGLSIIGFKVDQMSLAQSDAFYGRVLPVL